MDKMPPGPNPGLIWCNSKVTKPDELNRESFCRWYRSVHIPDVLETGAVREAYRYIAIDANEEMFHIALYYVDDVEGLYDKVKCNHTSAQVNGSDADDRASGTTSPQRHPWISGYVRLWLLRHQILQNCPSV